MSLTPKKQRKHSLSSKSRTKFNPDVIKAGDIIEARFTNSGRRFRFPARIIKVNPRTVRVVRCDGLKVYDNDPENRQFIIERRNTSNNGIFEFKGGEYK